MRRGGGGCKREIVMPFKQALSVGKDFVVVRYSAATNGVPNKNRFLPKVK
jgi:hypothetical protein